GDDAAFFARAIEAREDWRRRAADGTDDRACVDEGAVIEFDCAFLCSEDAGVEKDFDSAAFHFALAEFTEARIDFRKNLVATVNERDRHIFGAEVLEEARAGFDEVVDFAGDFDAAESAADDNKRQVSPAAFRVVARFGLLQLLENLGAQREGV